MTASGCVWSTCGAGTNACSSVSIDGRGWSGCTRAAQEVVDHRRVVHRLALAQRQHLVEAQRRRSPAAVIVARSVPEPLTQSTRVSRPAWSTIVSFADVLPPPLVRERAVGAEQVRAVDERRRAVERPPAAAPSQRSSGAGMPCSDAQHLAHARTSSVGERSREPAKRSRASLPARRLRAARRRSARTSARTTSRASASERSRRAPSPARAGCRASVASSGPASTGRPAASAVHRQSSSLRAPPPTTWISGGSRRSPRRAARPSARASARGSRGCSARSRRDRRGSGWPSRAQYAAIRAGMSPGAANAGVVRVDEGLQRAARRRASATSSSNECSRPALRPGAAALVQEPEPGHVAQQPERAVDAALVRQVRA